MKESKQTIPPKPEKPSPNECCGSGCSPCVFDYYYTAMEKWQKKWGHTKDQVDAPNSDAS